MSRLGLCRGLRLQGQRVNEAVRPKMFKFLKKTVWPPNHHRPPWGTRKSIYDHITEHFDPTRPVGLSEDGYLLPDEGVPDLNSLSFAPGALDGVFGHHGSMEPEDAIVAKLYLALTAACPNASDRNVRTLYKLLTDGSAMEVIDPLIERIHREQDVDADRLREIVYWFTTKAADREAVKFSMALLGLLRGCDDSSVFLTLGRHDEFTLYSAVAIANNEAYGDEVLCVLAKAAEGWGRISAVERLAGTNDAEIKNWLLRDGFKNSVMYEYLACICARAGQLHVALEQDEIDVELFNSATDLIDALMSGEGGPAEGLVDYEFGCTAIGHLLAHGDSRFATASHFGFLWRLKDYVDAYLSGERELEQDWSKPNAARIAQNIEELLSGRDWTNVISDALKNRDPQTFWDASRVCSRLGIDPWPHFFDRTKEGGDYWWDLMRTSDASRIDDVLALAEDIIPLDDIATGPKTELGLGVEFGAHSALDFILQDLDSFPGKGWALIEAGLRSPVIRNRNMGLKALSAWPKETWPEGSEDALHRFMEAEPEMEVRERFKNVLEGRSLD